MTEFSEELRSRTAKAARFYISGSNKSRPTRGRPSGKLTIADLATIHQTNLPLLKKYIRLLKEGKDLPSEASDSLRGGIPCLTKQEEAALITYIQKVENTSFQLTDACIVNKANFLRRLGNEGPVSYKWLPRFKARHPELTSRVGRFKEVTRIGAELDPDELEAWYTEYENVAKGLQIEPDNLWNFDETPLQIGWARGKVKIASIRKKKSSRQILFQPGNKESLTSIDAISAAGRYIPSFLILSVKALLEDYAFADVDDDVVITHTDTGYNNAHRALQWLKHFNYHSFKASDSFKGHTIESWFGYAADINYKGWEERVNKEPFCIRTTPRVTRLLLMDGFAAHEDPEFLWYCDMFDIVPFKLPSHMSHLMQPLDVGVFQHVKQSQQRSLQKWVRSGGLQITRYDFLCSWKGIVKDSFRVGYIYTGFENSGLWPIDPDKVLSIVRAQREEQTRPMWPNLLHETVATPRSAKRKLANISITNINEDLKKAVDNALIALDYSIISQDAQLEALKLARERLAQQAARTRTMRRIAGTKDGAFTRGQLLAKVKAREEKEHNELLKKQARMQKAELRKLRAQEAASQAASQASQPRLRGRAAAKAKAEAEARAREQLASMNSQVQEQYLNIREAWDQADNSQKIQLSAIMPLDALESIPDYSDWLAAQEVRREAAAAVEALPQLARHPLSSPNAGYITVATNSSVGLPGSDNSVEIITHRPPGSTWARDISIPAGRPVDSHGREVEFISQAWSGELHYAPANYSSDDTEIMVGGVPIRVPKSRARAP
uniref:HTH CENPB-type domain-containing protein n=2 Tax=Bionectria ochroleuca TaxID=29856 RepID=A0A8H7K2Q4_BIOOC